MKRLFVLILCCFTLVGCASSKTTLTQSTTIPVLIDPGHGGFDGGAVAADGTTEKHINLAIALMLRDVLAVCGVPVTLTRDTDKALNAEDAHAVRSNKTSDMQARLALYQQAEVVISVHQNHFDVPKYSGTQVFYSGNHTDSQQLADSIHSAVVEQLQPENHREIKKATNGIYLLHHTTAPCVLVECGFLSNPKEREQLKTPEYQQRIALTIASGYWKYQTTK